jgi:hypothetical protein
MKEKLIELILSFSVISTIFIFYILLNYVIINDYIIIPLYQFSESMVSSGNMSASFLPIIESVVGIIANIPLYVDYMFLFLAVTTVIILLRESYISKRRGYFTTLTYLTLGVIVILAVSSIVNQINGFLYNALIGGVLSSLSVNLKYYTFYIANYGMINAVLVVSCIVANFIPLDFSKFNLRKQEDRVLMSNDNNNSGGDLV